MRLGKTEFDMRFLVLIAFLAVPFAASANCPEGNNAPLTSDTNETKMPPASETAQGNTSHGSDKATKTAYPH